MRALLALVLLVGACSDGVSADPGPDALLQIPGAQYRPGAFPVENGGPTSIQLAPRTASIQIAYLDNPTRGVMSGDARSAIIGIDGVDGTWLLPAEAADVDVLGSTTTHFSFALADDFPPGPFTLSLAAVDADARVGPRVSTELVADAAPLPAGTLVIGLSWIGPADLDLHVVDPLGGEAWSDKPNTMTPPVPGEPPDPDGWKRFGTLDHDGNMNCTQHANPNEHVVWTMPPPSGDYVVRVDTRSMCGAPSAAWFVDAYLDGELLGSARGTSTPGDVELSIDIIGLGRAGAGVTALKFSL
ncbi:MAG TPA: hypothetical protein VGM39_22255 [Kofleriaceae bacterium]|jgi:hypothetical protein